MPKYIETLEEFKAETGKDQYTLIDFTASWCGPCKMISPEFERLDGEYPNVHCFKVDVDDNDAAAAHAKIQAMPTFKLYKNGQVVKEMVGASKDKLKELFDAAQ